MTPNNYFYAANFEENVEIRFDLDTNIIEMNIDGFHKRIYESTLDLLDVYLALRRDCHTETFCQAGLKITREINR
jgi:hypothetical protein